MEWDVHADDELQCACGALGAPPRKAHRRQRRRPSAGAARNDIFARRCRSESCRYLRGDRRRTGARRGNAAFNVHRTPPVGRSVRERLPPANERNDCNVSNDPNAPNDPNDILFDGLNPPLTTLLHNILTSRVYAVARETPPGPAPGLSRRLGHTVLLKREDLQPVFSFKLRGAYNKIAHLTAAERARGVITASAGNHAQG